MDTRKLLHFTFSARHLALSGLLACATGNALAGITDLADAPLVTSATSSVLPNVLFILDDSGSMYWDFMPDIVNDNYCKSTTGSYDYPCCADLTTNGGSGSTSCWIKDSSTAAPFGNWRAKPLFLVNQFNGVGYNPAITYSPPLNYDGTSKATMNSANTSAWTSVKNDAYNVQSTTSINMTNQFPDETWCTDTGYTDCLRNDNYLLPGVVNGKNYKTVKVTTGTGSGSVATGSPYAPTTATRDFGPHFYTIVPGEYCDGANLRTCQSTQDSTYSFPAYIRWCNSTAATTAATANPNAGGTQCQATKTPTFKYIRYPTKFFTPAVAAVAEVPGQPFIAPVAAVQAKASFTVVLPPNNTSGCYNSSKAKVTAVWVNGVNILKAATSSEFLPASLANSIRGNIGNGYTATVSGATVTLIGSLAQGNITYPVTFTYTKTGTTCNFSTTPSSSSIPSSVVFSGGVNAVVGQPYIAYSPAIPAQPAVYPGSFIRTDIVPSVTSYPYPGSATKAVSRTDCAGSTCTYAEEMTNFTNWWTYYHTRMQMMKSSASISFGPIDQSYRVGFMTIDNANGSDFINVSAFNSTQKQNWYAKLAAAKPSGGTPLRNALTTAGRMYGGRLSKINNVTVVDPMQYSCQQNFTILSTDGFWNDANPGGYQLDGSTAVGDQDSSSQRPQFDGTYTLNTLADTAAYYYNTDLRASPYCTGSVVPPAATGNDVCNNNVPVSGLDAAAHQHMTTFTVGLGANGYMQFSPSYETSNSGDFFDIKHGTAANPGGGICSWQASGSCTWPAAAADTPTAIDDLWHAAVNGYGTYFSATNPAVLSAGLSNALAGVSARTGSSAAATTSNPNVATGDNFLFRSTFTSVNWDGEMVRNQLDVNTGAISDTADWSARELLNSNTNRKIYTFSPGATDNLKEFLYTNLSPTEKAFFTTPNVNLSQFCASGATCLAAAQQTDAKGSKLVDYLRGDRSYEGASGDTTKYYRQRDYILGDIVNSEAVYVKKAPFNYTDSGYDSFKISSSARQGMVYVGANDGMVHAFNADTGQEVWAYVPSMVMANMYKTADKNYANLHRYTVDGTVVQSDVYFNNAWHSVLIGGLNAGGRGYYALDVTDPTHPIALWEFTHDTSKSAISGYTVNANLGFTYGKAEISKLKDSSWVALVTSGYNNISPGDGQGYLYVLDIATGAIKSTVPTNKGTTGTPSGLGQVRAWVDLSDLNNLALRAYGGDMLGNVFRFDIDNNLGPTGNEAQLLATLQGSTGNVQPITSKPELGLVKTTKANGDAVAYPLVYVGTGRYFGVSDLTDTSGQSIYGIKDNLGQTSYGNPRASGNNFVQQTLTATTCPVNTPTWICGPGQLVRTSSKNAVDLNNQNGWYVDLPDSGERINTDPQLALGTLTLTSNIPNATACTIGGYSFVYFFDYTNGWPVSSSPTGVTGVSLGNALATRPVVVKLPNGKVISVIQQSNGKPVAQGTPTSGQQNPTRRVTWRELVTE